MFTKNSEITKQLLDKKVQTSQRLAYRQPKLYSLGSLEQVQAYYQGKKLDGPDASYYYTPRRR